VNEAKRFVDFAQHQRVALPLFLGRTKMYLEDRLTHKEAELTTKVSFTHSFIVCEDEHD
jgi:hypothetical protein